MSAPDAAGPGLCAPSTILAVTGLNREARSLAGPAVTALPGGGDRAALTARLQAAVAAGRLRGVISVGLGGAVSPDLRVGDWVVADQIVGAEHSWPTHGRWTQHLREGLATSARRVFTGTIAGSDVMVADAAAKAALHAATGALAVDMESHVAARFAAEHGLPFAALRVISDAADHALPRAAQAGMRPDGGMDVLAVLRALARDPRQLPALIRTARDAETAFRRLALLGRHDLLGRLGVGDTDLG